MTKVALSVGEPLRDHPENEHSSSHKQPPPETQLSKDAKISGEPRETMAQVDSSNERKTNGTNRMAYAPLLDRPAYSAHRKLRVITIGAGFSGIIFAHKLRYEYPEMEELVSNTIFEARHEIGGTWLVNTYPGVQCDVPSHIYAFPFDPNPDWDRFYSTGPEIQDYLVRTVKKWKLDRDIQFNNRVVGLHWEEDLGQWMVTVECQGVQRIEIADFVISAQGFLNSWKWPAIPGLHDFRGFKVHSASWDHSYDFSGKRIATIGNGSSGIQILPQLANLENTDIVSFQRNPTWVVNKLDPGSLLGKPGGGSNPTYTEEEKRIFREDPRAHWKYRKAIINSVNKAFRMVWCKSLAARLSTNSHQHST